MQLEKLTGDWIEQTMDLSRDLRDAWYEASFYAIWAGPLATWFGQKNAQHRALPAPGSLRNLPEAETALANIKQGGSAEAVARMLILLADSHKGFRSDMLDRWAQVFTQEAPFKDLTVAARQKLLHEQTLIATFAPEEAIQTLPDLLPDAKSRKAAVALIERIIGEVRQPAEAMKAKARDMLQTLDLKDAC